jgi:hypothetical protein
MLLAVRKGRDMDASQRERGVRAARNQSLFREVNERIEKIADAAREEIGYVCECLDLDCNQQIQLSAGQYEAVRSRGSACFFVKPGHTDARVERVVASYDGYEVVEKLGAAGDVAASFDLRAREATSAS